MCAAGKAVKTYTRTTDPYVIKLLCGENRIVLGPGAHWQPLPPTQENDCQKTLCSLMHIFKTMKKLLIYTF